MSIGIAVEIIGNGTGLGLQMTGITSVTIGWIIIVVSNAVGIGLISYALGRRVEIITSTPHQVILRERKRLNSSHNITLLEIEQLMGSIHGHSDFEGLKAEMLEGVPINDLMKHDCTRCGKPRNQKGDLVL